MSGNCRSALGLAITRQQRKITEVQTFTTSNGIYTQKRREDATKLVKKLQTSLDEFERIDDEWKEILSKIQDATELQTEQALFDLHAFDTKDPNKTAYKVIMGDTEDAIADLEAEIELIDIALNKTAATPASVLPPTVNLPGQLLLLNSPATETKKRLYHGNPEGYKAFLEDWISTVGSRTDITNVVKLSMLKQRLDGEAYTAISRYSTDAGYQDALDKLKQRFGRDEDATNSLRKKLFFAVKNTHDLDAVRKAFDDFEYYLVTLGGYGKDIESSEFKDALRRKLPDNIKDKLADWECTLPAGVATVTEYRAHCDLLISNLQRNYGKFLPQTQSQQLQQQSQQQFQRQKKPEFRRSTVAAAPVQSDKPHRFSKTSNSNQKPRRPPRCSFCEGVHYNDSCPSVTTKSGARKIAEEKHLCLNCFRGHHSAENCAVKQTCKKCSGFHHTLNCPGKQSFKEKFKNSKDESYVVASNKVVTNGESEVMLLSREVYVSHPENPKRRQKVLVFVDNGAQVSLIDKKLANSMKLHSDKKSVECQSAGGSVFATNNSYKLNIQLEDGSLYPVQAYGTSQMIKNLTVPKLPAQKVFDLSTTKMTPLSITYGNPLILLSMKVYADLVASQPVKHLRNGFILIESKLGALIGGEGSVNRQCLRPKSPIVATIRVPSEFLNENDQEIPEELIPKFPSETSVEKTSKIKETNVLSSKSSEPQSLATSTENKELVVAQVCAKSITENPTFLYDLELIGIKDDPNADEYRLFQQRFLETVRQEPDGRIYVDLPFHDLTNLGTNYNNCYRRLAFLSKRFVRDPDYARVYKQAVDEFFTNNFTELVPNSVINNADSHYMPHSLVLTPGKTTPARLVFDGSCKTEKGESINDKLLTGDNRLPKLAGILLRARFYPIIVASDVKKAFLQIHLNDSSKKYVRFLFLKDVDQPLSPENILVYQFRVVPFGLNCSLNLLGHAIEYHLTNYAKICPIFAKHLPQVLKNNFVDNLLMGSELIQESISANESVKKVFAKGQMDLRGQVSNNAEVNKHFGATENSFNLLGHKLDISKDTLQIGWTNYNVNEPPKTKRALLSFSASLFDLMGILEPIRLPLKLLIRRAWDKKLNWSSVMDAELVEEAEKLFEERRNFVMNILRYAFGEKAPKSVQLHVFGDASGVAYGCVAYIRFLNHLGKYLTVLIFAKSRIMPLKPVMNIVQAELAAADLSTSVANFLREELQSVMDINQTYVHSDNEPVYFWIKNPENKGRFVINRVIKIQASNVKVLHVPGILNPADKVSRGCSPAELKDDKLWFEGPEFLRQPEEFWPVQPDLKEIAETAEPLIIAALNAPMKIIVTERKPLADATTFKSWKSLAKTYYFVLKFVCKLSTKFSKAVMKTDCPSDVKLQCKAEHILIKEIQTSANITSERFHELDLYLRDGVIKKYCKIKLNADPIFLSDCPALRLLILDIHKRMNHGSVAMILAQFNQRFYLPKARSIIKSTLRNRCMNCRRQKAVPFSLPLMNDLPLARSVGKPYEAVGIDLAGPFQVKVEGLPEPKSHWVVLFTCFLTRAIHLEVVPSLSGEAFIEALTRFASRRGMPSFIFSDNGTNMKVTAATVIPKWIMKEDPDVMSYCTSQKIHWKFNTEKAPWSGGVYESMIKLLKVNLKRAVGKKQFTLWKLLTLLAQTEAWVNSRPLTYISDDPNQMIIRPIDFTSPYIKPGLPDIDVDGDPDFNLGTSHENLVALWSTFVSHLKTFTEGFNKDYLQMLRDRSRYHNQSGNVIDREPHVGEVVIIYDENTDKELWRLGKIEEVMKGSDGRCRAAKVKTPSGRILQRPLNHLLPLEVDPTSMKNPSQPIKARNLPKRGDPLLLDHPTPPENVPNEVESTVLPPKAHPMRTRQDVRRPKVAPILRVHPWIILICCIFACFTSTIGFRCTISDKVEKVFESPCKVKDYAVYRTSDGYCWTENFCLKVNQQSLHTSDSLNPVHDHSECPAWAHGCSLNRPPDLQLGNSTSSHPKVKLALLTLKPHFCSTKEESHCDHIQKRQEMMQVQLLDDSLHFVKELHLMHQQVHEDAFKCFGDGADGFDGPEIYCQTSHSKCYHDASSVCVPTFIDKHFLVTSHGNIELKAWGHVTAPVYAHRETQNSEVKVNCSSGKITILGTRSNDVIQIDHLNSKSFLKAQDKNTEVLLPKRLSIAEHSFQVTLWTKGLQRTPVTVKCPKQEVCDLFDCVLCPEILANLECTPWWLWILLFTFMILLPLLIIEIVYLIKRQKRGQRASLLRALMSLIAAQKKYFASSIPQKDIAEEIPLVHVNQVLLLEKANEMPAIPIERSPNEAPTLPHIRYKSSTIAVCLTICLILLPMSNAANQVISFQAKNDLCVRSADGTKTCQHNTVAHFTVEDQNVIEMIFEDDEAKPQASLIVTVKPIAQCQKGFSTYSRNVDVEVYSSKRCPQSGSCIDEVCEKTSANTTIPELTLVNKYPGVSSCSASCGCWGCGCFICSDSCTFFRYFAKPIDQEIYEEFTCRKWIFGAELQITHRSNHRNQTKTIYLEEGTSQDLEYLKISLPAVRSADIMSFKSFISDGTRLAFSNDHTSTAMKLLQCDTKFSAENLRCKLKEDACHCLSAGTGVNCKCKQNHILKTQLDDSFLPSEKAEIHIDDQAVRYVLEKSTTDIIIEVQHLQVVTQVDIENCKLIHADAHGCANCPNGAFVLIQCDSPFNNAFGVVRCGKSLKFSVLCNALSHITIADFIQSQVSLNCSLHCSGNTVDFNLNGTLHFFDDLSVFNNTKSTATVPWTAAAKTFLENILKSYSLIFIVIAGIVVVILLK